MSLSSYKKRRFPLFSCLISCVSYHPLSHSIKDSVHHTQLPMQSFSSLLWSSQILSLLLYFHTRSIPSEIAFRSRLHSSLNIWISIPSFLFFFPRLKSVFGVKKMRYHKLLWWKKKRDEHASQMASEEMRRRWDVWEKVFLPQNEWILNSKSNFVCLEKYKRITFLRREKVSQTYFGVRTAPRVLFSMSMHL